MDGTLRSESVDNNQSVDTKGILKQECDLLNRPNVYKRMNLDSDPVSVHQICPKSLGV